MMKKTIRELLLFLMILYVVAGYSDFKKGFVEGFEYTRENQFIQKPAGSHNANKNYTDAGTAFPLIIKM